MTMKFVVTARQLSILLLLCWFNFESTVADQDDFNPVYSQDGQSVDQDIGEAVDGHDFQSPLRTYALANAAVQSIRGNRYDQRDGAPSPDGVQSPSDQQFDELPLDRRPLFLEALLTSVNGKLFDTMVAYRSLT